MPNPVPAIPANAGARVRGVALIILAAACFGAMGWFARLAYADGVDPHSLLFMRFALASVLLASGAAARRASWPRGPPLALAAAMGAIFVGNSICFFLALQLAPAATVAIVFFLYPVIVACGARLLFAETLTARKLAALGLAVAGCAGVAGPTELGAVAGVLLALLAAFIYSAYVLLARFMPSDTDSMAQASVITGVCAAIFGVWVAVHGLALPQSAPGWSGTLALAVVSTVFPIAAFLAGVRLLGATGAATLSVLEPVVAAVLGVLVLHEPLDWHSMAGAALIVASAWLAASTSKPDPPPDDGAPRAEAT